MQFDGKELLEILNGQRDEVAIYNTASFLRGYVPPQAAIEATRSGNYVGVGNRRRIRYLRPLSTESRPRTTRRICNEAGVAIAPLPHVEHRPSEALRGWNRGRFHG